MARSLLRFLAGLVAVVTAAVALVIVLGTVFVLLKANLANPIVRELVGAKELLAGPFDAVFRPRDARLAIVVSAAIALIVYLVAGRVLVTLLRRVAAIQSTAERPDVRKRDVAVQQQKPHRQRPEPPVEPADESAAQVAADASGVPDEPPGQSHEQVWRPPEPVPRSPEQVAATAAPSPEPVSETRDEPVAAVPDPEHAGHKPPVSANVSQMQAQPTVAPRAARKATAAPLARRLRERPALAVGAAVMAGLLVRSRIRRR